MLESRRAPTFSYLRQTRTHIYIEKTKKTSQANPKTLSRYDRSFQTNIPHTNGACILGSFSLLSWNLTQHTRQHMYLEPQRDTFWRVLGYPKNLAKSMAPLWLLVYLKQKIMTTPPPHQIYQKTPENQQNPTKTDFRSPSQVQADPSNAPPNRADSRPVKRPRWSVWVSGFFFFFFPGVRFFWFCLLVKASFSKDESLLLEDGPSILSTQKSRLVDPWVWNPKESENKTGEYHASSEPFACKLNQLWLSDSRLAHTYSRKAVSPPKQKQNK